MPCAFHLDVFCFMRQSSGFFLLLSVSNLVTEMTSCICGGNELYIVKAALCCVVFFWQKSTAMWQKAMQPLLIGSITWALAYADSGMVLESCADQ